MRYLFILKFKTTPDSEVLREIALRGSPNNGNKENQMREIVAQFEISGQISHVCLMLHFHEWSLSELQVESLVLPCFFVVLM